MARDRSGGVGSGRSQRRNRYFTRFGDLHDVIHHHIHGLAAVADKIERALKELSSSLAIQCRKNDEAGAKLALANQSPKITRVLGNDHAILGDAPFEHTVVWLAPPPHMERTHRIVTAGAVQSYCQLRRQAFIDE